MTAMRRIGAAVIALGLALGLSAVVPAAPALGDVDDYEFESFDSVIELGIDGERRSTATITETIVAVFPEFDQNRGIVRAIPLSDQGYPFGLEVVSVTDGDGVPVEWERDDDDGFAVLALGTDEFVQGRQTYVIEYELHDVIRHFADSGGDEFTWDVNGDGWAQPFGSVTAEVLVSSALAASLTGNAVCYAGLGEIREPCELQQQDARFVATAGPLDPFRTLTVSIGFEGGTVVQPQRPVDSWVVTVLPWLLLGLMAVLLVATIVARAVIWRDPQRRRALIAEFVPPSPRDLRLDGDLLRRPGPVFAALVVDLAIRGVVRIVDLDEASKADERYGIELVDPALATKPEVELLEALFDGALEPGAVVRPSEMTAQTGAAVHAALAAAPAEALDLGLRRKPSARWTIAPRVAAVVLVAATAVPFVWMIGYDLELVWVVLTGIVAIAVAIAVWALTVAPALLTADGADRRDHLLGIREYLTVAERDRFRMLQSPEGATRVARALGAEQVGAPDRADIVKLNERLLPWAVLWGVEDEWSKVLVAASADAGVESSAVVMGLASGEVLRWASSSSTRMSTLASTGGSSWSGSGGSSFGSSSFGGGFAGGGGGGGGGGGR